MSEATETDLLFAIPFDYTVFAEPELLGSDRPIKLASQEGRLRLPHDRDPEGNLGLLPPDSAPEGFGAHLPEGWGLRPEGQPWVELNAILVVVPVAAELNFELSGNQIGGEEVQQTLSEVRQWFESLIHWLWVSTAQSLDPLNPDPKVLHRPSNNLIVAARTGDQSSLPSAGSPTLVVTVDSGGPASERVVDERVLDLAVKRAGLGPAPLALELLASARMEARRGDGRRALVDAGSATEGALTRVLKLPPNHTNTLGQLVTLASRQGVGIPADTSTSLVQPRNDAVHRGQLGPNANVGRAIEIAEEIVALVEADLIRASSLRAVNRPQRQDLVIIRPRSQNVDGQDTEGSE